MPKVMIIDDDVELTNNTAALLRKDGYEVSTLYTTEKALDAIRKDGPDVLILDVMFPDNPVGGFDLARLIRRSRTHQHLPILLLTGVNQEFPMDFSAKDIDTEWMPVQDFIEKPASLPTLLAKLRSMLKTRA